MQDRSPDLLGTGKKLQRPSRLAPVLIALVCAVILTGGSLYGVAFTCNYNPRSEWKDIFAFGALVGLAVTVLCLAVIVLWTIWFIVKKFWGNP